MRKIEIQLWNKFGSGGGSVVGIANSVEEALQGVRKLLEQLHIPWSTVGWKVMSDEETDEDFHDLLGDEQAIREAYRKSKEMAKERNESHKNN